MIPVKHKRKMKLHQKLRVKFWRRCADVHAKLYFLKNNKLHDLVVEVKKLSESVGLSDHEYMRLYQMVRNLRPEYVLECGTGKSTFIIAHAMCQNGNAKKLVSMEESKDWAAKQQSSLSYFWGHARAKEWFPGNVNDLVELAHSEVGAERYRIWDGSCYTNIDDHPYTFVMVDGPQLQETHFMNMDLINVLKTAQRSICAWIDGRWATVAMCRALFGDKVVSKVGWTHSEIYGATREDLSKSKKLIAREMFKMVKRI